MVMGLDMVWFLGMGVLGEGVEVDVLGVVVF